MNKELLISDITLMHDRFCVIGLALGSCGFVSVRPIPKGDYGWKRFPHDRGSRLQFTAGEQGRSIAAPHIEDWHTDENAMYSGNPVDTISEQALVDCLRRAETARSTDQLFGCSLKMKRSGAAYANPRMARRSIAGCTISSLRFLDVLFPNSRQYVAMQFVSGETLQKVPLVDKAWRTFIKEAGMINMERRNPARRLENFFDSVIDKHVISSPLRFVRLGLSRPSEKLEGVCWLMADSIFPQPKHEWLVDL